MYVHALLLVPHEVQVEHTLEVKLLPVTDAPRVVTVCRVDQKDLYVVKFSDGATSDPMRWQDLDDVAQAIWSDSSVSTPMKRRHGRRLEEDRDRRRRHQKANAKHWDKKKRKQRRVVDNEKLPNMLRPFGSPATAQRLQESIDSEWQRQLDGDREQIEQFPQIPTDERIKHSLKRYRERVSSPHVDYGVCAVCAERHNAQKIHTFALAEHDDNTHTVIGPELLQFMQDRLRHNPKNPRHLDYDLPECTSCNDVVCH